MSAQLSAPCDPKARGAGHRCAFHRLMKGKKKRDMSDKREMLNEGQEEGECVGGKKRKRLNEGQEEGDAE